MGTWNRIAALFKAGTDATVVTIIATRGSVPGEVGAKAIVTDAGLIHGNLGGGKVEAKAIQEAKMILATQETCVIRTWNLRKDVGMTCGGEMSFLFEKVSAKHGWHIAVFGAGHVSQALVPVLATLDCRIDVIDTRADWLERLTPSDRVTVRLVGSYRDGLDFLDEHSFVISVTQGHSSDLPVLRAVLERFPEIPYLGVIGSLSKRALLMRELREEGIETGLLEKIRCPLGLPVGGNDPAEIAISVAAQLLETRDRRSRPGGENS